MQTAEEKRRETIFIIILILLLAAIFIVSKFALGINLRVLENTYDSVGFFEVKKDGAWAVSYTVFDGEISNEAPLVPGQTHRYCVRGESETGKPELTITAGETETSYPFDGQLICTEVSDETDSIRMRFSAHADEPNGFFDILWE